MQNLLAARAQMGMSLAFHIVFACVGVAMPLLMAIAEWRYLRTGDEVYYRLARRWAVGTAIMFAVGAVSGTVLSFELGLLWPQFMRWAGPIIGMPFSLEGVAFFTEAVFFGIYMYGWHRVSPRAHLAAGVLVALSGMASAVFVVIANSWMNTPVGFKIVHGKPVDIDPLAALTNPAALHETIHMTIAAYAATGFMVAGLYAFMLLRDRRPIIFPYSNPTSHSECTAEEAYTWSEGRAVFASGSPFSPVRWRDRTLVPGQGNNVYIFPAIGMAVYATNARRITDEMFIVAARAVAEQVTQAELDSGLIYPPQSTILQTEVHAAERVAEVIFKQSLARVPKPQDIGAFIRSRLYRPEYQPLV